jgi:hypothetical protein
MLWPRSLLIRDRITCATQGRFRRYLVQTSHHENTFGSDYLRLLLDVN